MNIILEDAGPEYEDGLKDLRIEYDGVNGPMAIRVLFNPTSLELADVLEATGEAIRRAEAK